MHTINRTDTWMEDLIGYLRDGLLPPVEKEADSLKRKAEWFIWHEGHLYKKSYTHPLREITSCGKYIREITSCGKYIREPAIVTRALEI